MTHFLLHVTFYVTPLSNILEVTTIAICLLYILGFKNSTFLCNLMFSAVLDFGILQGANSESISKRERGQHMEMTIYAFII